MLHIYFRPISPQQTSRRRKGLLKYKPAVVKGKKVDRLEWRILSRLHSRLKRVMHYPYQVILMFRAELLHCCVRHSFSFDTFLQFSITFTPFILVSSALWLIEIRIAKSAKSQLWKHKKKLWYNFCKAQVIKS